MVTTQFNVTTNNFFFDMASAIYFDQNTPGVV